MSRTATPVSFSSEELEKLVVLVSRGPKWRATRARIALLAAHGLENREIVVVLRETGHRASKNTVTTWRRRLAREGLSALEE